MLSTQIIGQFEVHKSSQPHILTLKKLLKMGILSSHMIQNVILSQLDGLSNTTFKVTHTDKTIIPKPLVFKWYKNTFSMFVNRTLEIEIITKLAAKQQYPIVIHYNEECRVQEFIEGTSLDKIGTIDQHYLLIIVEKLAKFSKNYKLKNIDLVDRTFQNVVLQAHKIYKKICKKYPGKLHSQTQRMIQQMLSQQVISSIENMLPNQMVLSHNDVNMNNCIVDSIGHITIMDYEFACLNYLGYQIGNMFNEVATDYSNTFEIKQQWELSEETKSTLTSVYFETAGFDLDRPTQQRYIEIGRLMSHYFWMIIGVQSFEDRDCHLDLNYYITRRIEQVRKFLGKLKQA